MKKTTFQEGLQFADYHLSFPGNLQVDKQFFQTRLPLDGLRVLDFGCGKGSLSLWLAKTFECVVVGVDKDPENLIIARYLQRKNAVDRVQFKESEAYLVSSPETFDVIIFHEYLEYTDLDRLRFLIDKLSSRLTRNGQFVFAYSPFCGPYGSKIFHGIAVPWAQYFPRRWIQRKIKAVEARSNAEDRRDLSQILSRLNRFSSHKLAQVMADFPQFELADQVVHSLLRKRRLLSWLPVRSFPLNYLITREIDLYKRSKIT